MSIFLAVLKPGKVAVFYHQKQTVRGRILGRFDPLKSG